MECPQIDAYLRGQGTLVTLPDGIDENVLAEEVKDADILFMCYTPITRHVIEHATRLRGIVKYGVGIDAIDIPAAIEHRIPVVNIPEYAEETVAEGAFAMMIALAKKLVPLDTQLKREGWTWPQPQWLGADIASKTVGLVGVGKIGRSMARMAGAGFRARVLGYDPNVSAEEMQTSGVTKFDDLKTMLNECDFVTIHCTLSDKTHHLFGADEFAVMKPSAFLINVSRGEIVDERDMLLALQEGQIAGAGLDVFGQEPLSLKGHALSALYEMSNVILMPHLTFYTEEAMARLEDETIERCEELLQGKPVMVKSYDPRLRAQKVGVHFAG
ncbi:MAG: 2-hydroxyacid dehydrogenase [Hyphomicrobiales bacterium]